MHRLRAVVLGIVLLAVALPGVHSVSAQQNRIIVYSALPDLETSLVNREFTRRTGIQVEALSVAAAGTLQARIRAEKIGRAHV